MRNSTLYLKVREPFLRNAFPLAALVNWSNSDELCRASRSGRALKSRGSRYGPPDVVQMRDVEKACDDRAFGSPISIHMLGLSLRHRLCYRHRQEVIPCPHPHVLRNLQSRRCLVRNKSGGEPMNCTFSEAINPALSSTTGSKPKKRFAELKRKLSRKAEFLVNVQPLDRVAGQGDRCVCVFAPAGSILKLRPPQAKSRPCQRRIGCKPVLSTTRDGPQRDRARIGVAEHHSRFRELFAIRHAGVLIVPGQRKPLS